MGARRYKLPVEEIAARYNAGESIPQLAAAYECAEATIMKRLDWAGVVRRPGGKKLSPVAEIVRAYQSGVKVERIAARFKLDSSAVSRIARRYGCKPRRSKQSMGTPEKCRLARELRAQGLTYKEIGERIGVSKPTARHWVMKGDGE